MTTAACSSAITELDGENGILRYRGYPIEQLAEHSTYLEVAYLLIHGELPTAEQFDAWRHEITFHTFIHENMRKRFMEGFHYDAHPMGILVSVGRCAVSTFLPRGEGRSRTLPTSTRQIVRLIAKMPTHRRVCAYRFSVGMPFVYPDNSLDVLRRTSSRMMWKPLAERAATTPTPSWPAPSTCCSSCTPTTSRTAPPLRCASSAPPHCRSLHRVLRRVPRRAVRPPPRWGQRGRRQACSPRSAPSTTSRPSSTSVKGGNGGRLQGFGHRVYKNYDPRATIIKKTAYEVFEVTGKNPLLDIALKLEEVALSDDYFISRKLYPNVDFYSGLIYQALSFPIDMFPVMFAMPRTSGWLAHWGGNARAGLAHRATAPDLLRPGRARVRAHQPTGLSAASARSRP